jgi:hypothetical protein
LRAAAGSSKRERPQDCWGNAEKLKVESRSGGDGTRRGKPEMLNAESGKRKAEFGPHPPRSQRLLVAQANGQENAHPDFVLEDGTRVENG